MKKASIIIIMAAALLASCTPAVKPPKAGTRAAEICVGPEACTRTVYCGHEGLWRVSALESWLSVDVNGRDGRGGFTFSCSSNESDALIPRMSRKGHILITDIETAVCDTVVVLQRGLPEDAETVSSSSKVGWIEFDDPDDVSVSFCFANLDGATDIEAVKARARRYDIFALIAPAETAAAIAEACPGESVSSGDLCIIGGSSAPELISTATGLTARVGEVCVSLADFGAVPEAERTGAFRRLLDEGYNTLGAGSRWIVAGSFYHLSVMEMDCPDTPSWYPAKVADTAFETDLHAWKNHLLDCDWMVSRKFHPAWSGEDGRKWRPDYIYASQETFNGIVSYTTVGSLAPGMTHPATELIMKF